MANIYIYISVIWLEKLGVGAPPVSRTVRLETPTKGVMTDSGDFHILGQIAFFFNVQETCSIGGSAIFPNDIVHGPEGGNTVCMPLKCA